MLSLLLFVNHRCLYLPLPPRRFELYRGYLASLLERDSEAGVVLAASPELLVQSDPWQHPLVQRLLDEVRGGWIWIVNGYDDQQPLRKLPACCWTFREQRMLSGVGCLRVVAWVSKQVGTWVWENSAASRQHLSCCSCGLTPPGGLHSTEVAGHAPCVCSAGRPAVHIGGRACSGRCAAQSTAAEPAASCEWLCRCLWWEGSSQAELPL